MGETLKLPGNGPGSGETKFKELQGELVANALEQLRQAELLRLERELAEGQAEQQRSLDGIKLAQAEAQVDYVRGRFGMELAAQNLILFHATQGTPPSADHPEE